MIMVRFVGMSADIRRMTALTRRRGPKPVVMVAIQMAIVGIEKWLYLHHRASDEGTVAPVQPLLQGRDPIFLRIIIQ